MMHSDGNPPPAYARPQQQPIHTNQQPQMQYQSQPVQYQQPNQANQIPIGTNQQYVMNVPPPQMIAQPNSQVMYVPQHPQAPQIIQQQPGQQIPQVVVQNPNAYQQPARGVQNDDFGILIIAAVCGCFCCFCPTGLIAIYYALRGQRNAAAGDYATSAEDRKCAGIWIGLTFFFGVIMYIILFAG